MSKCKVCGAITEYDLCDECAALDRARGAQVYTYEQLYDLFVAHGVTTSEIAAMPVDVLTEQVGELRASNPDDIELSDDEIAWGILHYAKH